MADATSSGFTPRTDGKELEVTMRLRAYNSARQIVADLYAVKNDRGYPRFAGTVRDVVTEELRVARFLLEGDTE